MDDYIKYIRLGDAIETFDLAIADVFEDYSEYYTESGFTRAAIEEELRKVPTADVAPVRHGEWEIIESAIENAVCSCCGRRFQSYYEAYSYCPNCGAKMDKED